MKKARGVIVFVILTGLVALVCWQQQLISKLRADVAALRGEIDVQHSAHVAEDSTKGVPNEKEVETIRKEHVELLRLRGEVTRLKQQAKESEDQIPIDVPPALPLVLTTNDLHHVETNITAELKNNETMVTGGWDMANGKRAFMFVTPEFTDAKEIKLTTRIAEIATDKVTENLKEYLESGRLSDEDARRLFKTLEQEEGIDFLISPKVTTLSGRQAQMAVVDEVEIDGRKIQLGPVVDFIPAIAPDGSSVSLTVQAAITTTPGAAKK